MAESSTGDEESAARTAAQAVVADAQARTGAIPVVRVDPARRPDVLLRVRRPEGYQASVWWMIGAFGVVSAAAVLLLNLIPGGM